MKSKTKKAFTITELIVVMVIISALMALALPLVSTLISEANQDLTYNMIDSAGKNARSYVKTQAKVFTAVDAENDVREYGGVALVVTTENTLQLYESVETSFGYYVETYEKSGKTYKRSDGNSHRNLEPLMQDSATILDAEYQAFRKVGGWEEVTLPHKSIVLGLIMDGSTPKFITPPFAMRFNASSQLIYHAKSTNESSYVLIDGDYDMYFEPDRTRSGYDFQTWYRFGDNFTDLPPSMADEPGTYQIYDPDDSKAVSGSKASDRDEFFRFEAFNGQLKFPFDRLEAVMGLVIVDRDDFIAEGATGMADGTLTIDNDGGKWVLENGTIVMFNPQTGAAELGQINAKE